MIDLEILYTALAAFLGGNFNKPFPYFLSNSFRFVPTDFFMAFFMWFCELDIIALLYNYLIVRYIELFQSALLPLYRQLK